MNHYFPNTRYVESRKLMSNMISLIYSQKEFVPFPQYLLCPLQVYCMHCWACSGGARHTSLPAFCPLQRKAGSLPPGGTGACPLHPDTSCKSFLFPPSSHGGPIKAHELWGCLSCGHADVWPRELSSSAPCAAPVLDPLLAFPPRNRALRSWEHQRP